MLEAIYLTYIVVAARTSTITVSSKVRTESPDRLVNEKGEHVGTIISKGFRKKEIYCFLCDKIVSSPRHYEKEH